jgi:predicted membrane chloride channel (bestrophin family)
VQISLLITTDSRVFWGDIITQSLDFAMMNRRYIADKELSDRMSRYIIAFCYASMALLRGSSLGEEGGQGPALVDRGILTKEELDHMQQFPCWQPQWILDVIRAIVVEAHKVPNGKGIVVDESNKIHGQFVRCFDNGIKKLNDTIGDCVRTRASGLPASYDAITMTSFFTFFILASFVWSASIGWMTPIIIAAASMVIMLLIVMGSKLVDPFGLDKVDIPMEAFCATVEAQVNAIDERAKDGTILRFATGGVGKVKRSGKKLTSTVTIPKLR